MKYKAAKIANEGNTRKHASVRATQRSTIGGIGTAATPLDATSQPATYHDTDES